MINGQFASPVQLGATAPGGGTFSDLGQPVINNRGDIAFFASVINPFSSGGWYVADSSGVRLAAAKGTPLAPVGGQGTIGPLTINTVPFLSLNDCGDLLFHTEAITSGSNLDTILLSKVGGYLEVLAQANQFAPGGGTYSSFNVAPALNNSASAVLSPSIATPAGTVDNGSYITVN